MLNTLAHSTIVVQCLATALFLAYPFRFKPAIGRGARFLLWCSVLGQVALILGYVSQGTSDGQQAPVHRIPYMMALGVNLLYLLLSLKKDLTLIGSFLVPITTALVLANYFVQVDLSSHGIQSGDWIGAVTYVHIGSSLTGFLALTVSFAAAAMYLVREFALKSKSRLKWTERLPPLARLERVSRTMLLVGFALYTVGLVLGTVWVSRLGVGDFLKPQILLAIASWVILGATLQMQAINGWRGARSATLVAIGYVLALVSVLIYTIRGLTGA